MNVDRAGLAFAGIMVLAAIIVRNAILLIDCVTHANCPCALPRCCRHCAMTCRSAAWAGHPAQGLGVTEKTPA
jgi:hypothetical protein